MLAEALTAAISVGLGCGTCCGTSASSFLAVYILSEGGGFASSMKHVGGFFLGKVLAVCSITTICAAIGNVFIDENGYIGGFNLHHAMSWIMLASALFLLWKWFRDRKKNLLKMRRQVLLKEHEPRDPIVYRGTCLRSYSVRAADYGRGLRDHSVNSGSVPARNSVRARKLTFADAPDIRPVGRAQRQNPLAARQSDAVGSADGIYRVFDSCNSITVLV